MGQNIPRGNAQMKRSQTANSGSRNRRPRCPPARRGLWATGFSLLELMIVITIISILAAIALGRYDRSIQRSKEAVLKQDLFVMRNAIQQYTLDKEAGPTSLDDLVQGKYLSAIPTDPITRNKDWHPESEPILLDPQQTAPGITDVHSSSDQVSPFENTPYNTW
jgi:general secretion pathway protein G